MVNWLTALQHKLHKRVTTQAINNRAKNGTIITTEQFEKGVFPWEVGKLGSSSNSKRKYYNRKTNFTHTLASKN